MIIHRIHAKNVLKYTELRLEELPAQGLIAITGPNESGKSTIGETLCFALFGRTFSLDYEDLDKVIHWGRTHCSVVVDFTASDGERYTLERFLDDSGNHSARLALTGQAVDEAPLARGVEKVADLLYTLIGYEYEEFIESFYLAQREITTPHPHSYAIKTMAGLVTLEYCGNSIDEERQQAATAMEDTRKELASLGRQVEEIELDPDLLPRLHHERADLTDRVADYQRRSAALEQASLDYQDILPKRERALQGRGMAGFFRLLFLLLTLVSAAAWLFLTQLPEHDFATGLNRLFAQLIPAWDMDRVAWLLYLTIGFAVFTGLSWMRRSSLQRQLQQYRDTAQELAAILDDAVVAEARVDSPPGAETDTESDQPHTAEESQLPDETERRRLSQRVAALQADFPEVREGVGKVQHRLRELSRQAQERSGQLDESIAREHTRLAKVQGLNAMLQDLEQKNRQRSHHIELCRLGAELINGTMREISYQFNRKIRGLVGKTLPLFTEERYEHLQIGEDLTVRAFSSEKHDFMDLEEISSGTQRQIMLAVRLALSQELVSRAVKTDQFLFLDEPFAFFDQARTRNALRVLPKLSEQLNQIWIIGQEFPADLQFDRHIKCDRQYTTLPQVEG